MDLSTAISFSKEVAKDVGSRKLIPQSLVEILRDNLPPSDLYPVLCDIYSSV